MNSQLQFLGEYAFHSSSIECFSIPQNLIHIKEGCFSNCKELRKVDVESNSKLDIIGREAFDKTSIESFSIPSSVRMIDEYAFANCNKLRIVEIEENSRLFNFRPYVFFNIKCAIIMIPFSSNFLARCKFVFSDKKYFLDDVVTAGYEEDFEGINEEDFEGINEEDFEEEFEEEFEEDL